MIAFATIGRFCDEEMIVSVGTSKPEALALADKFVTDRRGDWDADADREGWLDSLSVVEWRGDVDTLRRLIGIAVYGVETTATASICRELNPYTKQEP
jgi:hypothetical protein